MAERRFNWILFVPPVIFAALVTAFYIGLNRDTPDELPSTMLGRTAPALPQSSLPGKIAPAPDALTTGGVKLVNFWASWCGPCRVEHPTLTRLAEEGVTVIGVNYKDRPADALAFLDELGDPYTAIGADDTGRTGIDWGIYGVPETFVVDADGAVLLRFPGPVTPDVYNARIRPVLEAAAE